MDSSVVIQLIILAVLILLSALFSSAETSLTTSNKLKIQSLADQGSKRARILLKISEDSGKMLSAILIGNNLAHDVSDHSAIRKFCGRYCDRCDHFIDLDLRRNFSKDTGNDPFRKDGAALCTADPFSDEDFYPGHFYCEQALHGSSVSSACQSGSEGQYNDRTRTSDHRGCQP